ncbi:hypothetical protein SLA2020_114840 [Shorea laevis]
MLKCKGNESKLSGSSSLLLSYIFRCDDEEKDVMDILLETYRDSNAEVKLTRDQIKYFFMEIFMTGVDTKSTAVQWTMTELINHPDEVLKKLREEIDSLLDSVDLSENQMPQISLTCKQLSRNPYGYILRGLCSGNEQHRLQNQWV